VTGWAANYPPGVTGNEPELTGEWPCHECHGTGGFIEFEDGHRTVDTCGDCQGKGYVTGEEADDR
jgi:DnaJ-class molecular chaperone